ncbi:hypothetical protein [uncultured Spirosoma sp.]|uniref:hypothetical protein n=1 Tax=uncultured Spirosoma sp. TaxID=278208 RepID=UPI00258F4F98|nr:hypothetical protein [uncultured Spirosoma sp.]
MEVGIKNKSEFDKVYNDLGIFTYHDDGFEVTLDNRKYFVKWWSIIGLVGYKKDLYSFDTIGLNVLCDNQLHFSFYEETPGWFQFLQHTKAVFKQIPEHWEIDIATPVFEPKPTLIYDRHGRTLAEFVSDEYPDPKLSLFRRFINRIMHGLD